MLINSLGRDDRVGVCDVKRERHYFVYMIASISRVLYIGMTSNLRKRAWEHKNGIFEGFSKEYRCHRLVWFESYDDVANAIDREKQLKRWNRIKKEWLIAQKNPTWEDLAAEWYPEHRATVQKFAGAVDRSDDETFE